VLTNTHKQTDATENIHLAPLATPVENRDNY